MCVALLFGMLIICSTGQSRQSEFEGWRGRRQMKTLIAILLIAGILLVGSLSAQAASNGFDAKIHDSHSEGVSGVPEPEPAIILLLGTCLLGLGYTIRKVKNKWNASY
jgi:heme/copper-type cytochrome/quinol oxidase subunit 3